MHERYSVFLLGSQRNDDQILSLSEILLEGSSETVTEIEDVRWIPRISPDSPVLNWVATEKYKPTQFAEFLSHIAIFRRFISECRADCLIYLRDDILKDQISTAIKHINDDPDETDFLVDADPTPDTADLVVNLCNVRAYRMSYRYVLRCLNIFDNCNISPNQSLFSYGSGSLVNPPWFTRMPSLCSTEEEKVLEHTADGVYFIPSSISEDVEKWLLYDSPYDNPAIELFLRHLDALKRASRDNTDSAILLEEGWFLCPDFDEKVGDLIDALPDETEVLILTHTIEDWDNMAFFPLPEFEDDVDIDEPGVFTPEERKTLFCKPHKDIVPKAYWISRGWIEKCLRFYDKPLRFFDESPTVDLIVPLVSPTTLVVYSPLIWRTDTQEHAEYFAAYGA